MNALAVNRHKLMERYAQYRQKKHITLIFFAVNSLVIFAVFYGLLTNSHAELSLAIFVVVLFFICSLPLLFISSFRGPGIIITVFFAFYFATFGLRDIYVLLYAVEVGQYSRDLFFTRGEWLIIITIISYSVGYCIALAMTPRKVGRVIDRDWSGSFTLMLGVVFWVVGTLINIYIQFWLADHFVSSSTQTLSASFLANFGGIMSLMRNLQPLGTLFFIYFFLVKRSRLALMLLVITAGFDFFHGFVADTKEVALRTPLLFIMSLLIIRQKIPIAWLVIALLVFSSTFSLFEAYRGSLHSRNESRIDSISNFGDRISKVFVQSSGNRFARGFEYLTSRVTLKQNIELLANGMGKTVPFLNGETIYPLLYAFIPRAFAPDKPDASATGRIFNHKFHISESRATYISISNNGDLYWNFGWTGLIIGMILVGFIMCLVASICRLDYHPNLPKFLILLLTIYLLVLRFETGLAEAYTYWIRTLVLLLIIHALMPKERKFNLTKVQPRHMRNGLGNDNVQENDSV